MILPSSHSPRKGDYAMGAARRDPRRGEIPMERCCRRLINARFPGRSRTNTGKEMQRRTPGNCHAVSPAPSFLHSEKKSCKRIPLCILKCSKAKERRNTYDERKLVIPQRRRLSGKPESGSRLRTRRNSPGIGASKQCRKPVLPNADRRADYIKIAEKTQPAHALPFGKCKRLRLHIRRTTGADTNNRQDACALLHRQSFQRTNAGRGRSLANQPGPIHPRRNGSTVKHLPIMQITRPSRSKPQCLKPQYSKPPRSKPQQSEPKTIVGANGKNSPK